VTSDFTILLSIRSSNNLFRPFSASLVPLELFSDCFGNAIFSCNLSVVVDNVYELLMLKFGYVERHVIGGLTLKGRVVKM